MFSLFKKKEPKAKVADFIFISKQAKWNALLELAKKQSSTIFIAWFDDSIDKLQQFFQQHQQEFQIISYRQLHSGLITDKPVAFIEHYPLAAKEQQVFSSLNTGVTVYSSLDEAFFKHFGGDKISGLMEKMGLQENEAISHSMITRSIYNAQEKLAAKVTVEQSAHSQEEWMQKNVGTIIS